jgi:hypothetical protein
MPHHSHDDQDQQGRELLYGTTGQNHRHRKHGEHDKQERWEGNARDPV